MRIKKAIAVALAMLFAVTAFAQRIPVNGTVVDEAGIPVFGATVLEVGSATPNGAVTDSEGKFTLFVRPASRLQVDCIGYVTQTIPAQNGIKVVLVEDSELLEETVVVGYGVQKKSDLTGPVASVKSEA